MLRFVLYFALFTGCGYFKKTTEAQPKASSSVEKLRAKYQGWLAEVKAAAVPSLQDCDLALWAGEAKAAGADVELVGFETAGAVRRNPTKPCPPASRDMVLGYVYGKWATPDLPALQRLATYGEANGWQMSADRDLSTIDPTGQALLARALDGLSGGKDKRPYEGLPLVCLPLKKDYEQHLQVLVALLGGEVADKLEGQSLLDIPAGCVEILKNFSAASPNDGLFSAAAGVYSGDMAPAFSLLLDEGYVCPTYVRGADAYCPIHKAFAAHTVLKRYQGSAP